MYQTRSSARLREKLVSRQASTPAVMTRAPANASKKPPPPRTQKKQKLAAHQEQNSTRASSSKVRGRKGSLKLVAEMPLDVLLEVFKYLEPLDLLRLSRASKALRAILLDRVAASSVWKSALANAESQPPECPPDLNPVQYASLLYCRNCMSCGSTAGTTFYYQLYVRFCASCSAKELIDFNVSSNETQLERDLQTIVNRAHGRIENRYSWALVLRSEFDAKRKELERLQGDKSSYDAYLQQQVEKIKERQEVLLGPDRYILRNWENSQKRKKINDVEMRRSIRTNAFIEKLEDLGYEEELGRLSHFALTTLPGVKGVKPLTEREWQKIKEELIPVMDEIRKDFIKKDRTRVIDSRLHALRSIRDYYASHHRDEIVPILNELANMEPFRAIVYDTPLDQQVAPANLFRFLEDIPALIESWRQSSVNVLLDLVPREKKSRRGKQKAQDPNILEKATTLFSCHWCPELLTYPRVLVHSCLLLDRSAEKSEDEGEETDQDTDNEDRDCLVIWNKGHGQVAFEEDASAYARHIITALECDPTTVTVKEMDELEQRVECIRCRKRTAHGRLVMTWRNAILHEFDKHSEENSCASGWQILDKDDIPKAMAKEETYKRNHPHSRNSDPLPRCVECDQRTILEGKVVSYPPNPWNALIRSDGNCAKKHDMSKGVYQPISDASFKRLPYPVKI